MDKRETTDEVHLSHSQIQEFVQCPKKYDLHRRLGLEPEFIPSGLLFGSAVHEAIALFHQARLEGREVDADELLTAFSSCWSAEALPIRYGTREGRAGLMRRAQAMLECYLADPHCAGEVLAVEEAFVLDLSPDLPPVVGRIDLVERAADGRLVVTDLKTSKNSKAPSIDQLVLYQEAAKDLDCTGNGRVTARYLVLTKTKEPEVVVYEPEIRPGEIERLCATYLEVWEAIKAGVKHPRTEWWCDSCQWQRYCDAYQPELEPMF